MNWQTLVRRDAKTMKSSFKHLDPTPSNITDLNLVKTFVWPGLSVCYLSVEGAGLPDVKSFLSCHWGYRNRKVVYLENEISYRVRLKYTIKCGFTDVQLIISITIKTTEAVFISVPRSLF